MLWFWLNVPLATMFFLAWVLIPLRLVLKDPESRPDTQHRAESARPQRALAFENPA